MLTATEVQAGKSTLPQTPQLSLVEIITRQKSPFVDYVKNVAGVETPVFGQELFQSPLSTFAPLDAMQVNGDYVIGPGDEIQLRGWGMVDIDITSTVDRNGSIYLPSVGSIRVAGVKYRDLQGYLKKSISRVFTNFDLATSVVQTRSVQIYVVGQAVRPGTYNLSSMSTLLNALFSSGGPTGSGSMRAIQVKRGGEVVTTFDLYDVLAHGDKSKDIALQDGDVVYIPPVGPQVAVVGDVKRPAVFELKDRTSLAEAVELAGGFLSSSPQREVIVEKNIDNRFQTVAELGGDSADIRGKLSHVPLSSADVIRIVAPGSVAVEAQKQREFVKVAGEVSKTGVFQIQKGETLRELMARLGGVTDNGYLFAMSVNRESVRLQQQAKLDEIADRFEKEIQTAATQKLAGTTDKDLAVTTKAELDRQQRLVDKMRTVKASGRIVLELDDSNAGIKNLPDLPLQDGDSIYIPRMPGTVDVLGSVYQQSTFIYKPGRTINDYLALAGGPTPGGDKSEMYVIRADGTVRSINNASWLSQLGGIKVNPGDAVVLPEKVERSSWTQTLKEWTSILYQFGLGAAGLKVLKD
nr:SLBB domain-containing protein [uncultured Pseudogulbenkiania sp.]